MGNLTDRMAALSPTKRAFFEIKLKKKTLDASGTQTIPRRVNRDSATLSFAQQRLWLLDQMEPESCAYNQPKAIRMSGALNVDALQKALDIIVDRHEVLRTTFTSVNGNPVQVICKSRSVNLSVIDLCQCPSMKRDAEIQSLIVEKTRIPFNLSEDLMLRANLLRLGEEEYVLHLVTHHIASDGWSSGILSREIAMFYEALATGKPSPLPDLPIQYADFAVWQRQWLQGEVLESQLSYWKQQLADSPAVLELPTDRPRPAVQTFRGARQSRGLPTKLTAALKGLSRQEEVTLFMTLLAAFQILLYRYTSQDDIVVGSPIAGRNRVKIEGLIGCFVNTLVLRTNLSGNPSFRELLGRIREVTLDAFAHQDLPFERLVEELHPERSLSHTPLFQVLFALQNAPMPAIELQGLILSPLKADSETAKFDLSLYLVDTEQGLIGTLEYNTDLFESATITRMLGHLQTLLEGIVANPEQRISDLPIMSPAEQHQLRVEWNDTKKAYPKDKCLHQLFEARAKRTPDAVAVVFPSTKLRTGPSTGSGRSDDDQLTYRQLNAKANQLAHHLKGLGVGPEVLVGICMERSLEMVIGLLGILKAGGTYVPLDPSYPRKRLAFMFEDTQLSVLLTQQRLMPNLPIQNQKSEIQNPVVVCLDTDWEVISQQSNEEPNSGSTSENLAYVIYTSGSTGKPKGVQIPHRAVVNFLSSMRQKPGLTDQDTLLAVTTLSFDIAALEIFLPLTVGARLVIVSREVSADGTRLLETMRSSGATVIQATPATWRILLEVGWQGNDQLKILCGGETLSPELAAQLLTRCSSLWNLYGPTESTIWSAVYKVDSIHGSVSVGRPIANTQIYILDSHLQPVPIGVAGELYIGGDGLARGYLNRPELTAEKFISNPFADEPGSRLYKTGDLARYLHDGNIEFLGRLDHQVKLRGFRIELGEVESMLGQHPAVRVTVVVIREDNLGGKRLVAYIVPETPPAPAVNKLRSFLKQKLPDYMVPSSFVFLDTLPVTPNGKVDRRALPIPDQTRPAPIKRFIAPQDVLELQLKEIWEEVLNINSIGVQDDFFALGGHSLLAVRLFAQIEQKLGNNLSLATIFQAATIKQQASILRHQTQN